MTSGCKKVTLANSSERLDCSLAMSASSLETSDCSLVMLGCSSEKLGYSLVKWGCSSVTSANNLARSGCMTDSLDCNSAMLASNLGMLANIQDHLVSSSESIREMRLQDFEADSEDSVEYLRDQEMA